MSSTIQTRALQTSFNQPIIIMQSPSSRAINLGFLQKNMFIPGRLNLGATREKHTYSATVDCLRLPPVQKIINRFDSSQISTITVLRETLACRLAQALIEVGMSAHFGDAFIGATHVKQSGKITTSYLYENIEGLHPKGLWLIADSICVGGDFGNNYFCPALAKKLYQDQLKKHHITPHIPTKQQILNIYKLGELLVES